MVKGECDYLAYLLRLWRSGPGESSRWCASLQNVQTGQRVGFACLDDAVAYLEQEMCEEGAGSGSGTEGTCVRQQSEG
jgi:hypothetical protein